MRINMTRNSCAVKLQGDYAIFTDKTTSLSVELHFDRDVRVSCVMIQRKDRRMTHTNRNERKIFRPRSYWQHPWLMCTASKNDTIVPLKSDEEEIGKHAQKDTLILSYWHNYFTFFLHFRCSAEDKLSWFFFECSVVNTPSTLARMITTYRIARWERVACNQARLCYSSQSRSYGYQETSFWALRRSKSIRQGNCQFDPWKHIWEAFSTDRTAVGVASIWLISVTCQLRCRVFIPLISLKTTHARA